MSGDAPTPFVWLSGGLFFGKSKGGIESVDNEKDVGTLLKDIQTNLDATLEASESAAAATASPATGGDSAAKAQPAGQPQDEPPNASAFLAARLARLRFLLYDERRMTSQQEIRRSSPAVASSTVQDLASPSLRGLIPKLLENLQLLPFESRKHVAAIFNYLLVCGFEGNDGDLYVPIMNAFRDHIDMHFEVILPPIMKGHGAITGRSGGTDVALHCGSMYRSCFRHVSLYRQLVFSTPRVEQYVLPFLDTYALQPDFDVSSDAMESLKLVMTAGTVDNSGSSNNPNTMTGTLDDAMQREMSELSAAFLTRDYEAVWYQRFNPNLLGDQANYMTKRVALQILSTVLLTRVNYAVMIRYVNSRNNLILVMKLLRDPSPHITLDAFHVFKVFVANPSKIPGASYLIQELIVFLLYLSRLTFSHFVATNCEEVEKILRDNSVKLCAYLETLHQEKELNDQQFSDEKKLIIATIRAL